MQIIPFWGGGPKNHPIDECSAKMLAGASKKLCCLSVLLSGSGSLDETGREGFCLLLDQIRNEIDVVRFAEQAMRKAGRNR